MRVYFIFDIKDEFVNLYRDNERVLFNILRQIYYLEKEDIIYASNLFSQLVNRIDKDELDRYLFLKLHQNIPYSKRGDIHFYNNLYKDEISKLIVKRSYIKLETEQVSSSFFEILSSYKNNYFICEFKYQDYFFLNGENIKETI